MDAPVMKEALSEATNTMAWAISSGKPARLSGTRETSAALLSSLPVNRFSIPVSMGPGATTLTRPPEGGRHVDDAALPPRQHHAQLMLQAQQRAQHIGVESGRVALSGLLSY